MPGLANNQRHLTLTLTDAFPAAQQRAQLLFAADERGQSAGCRCSFEAPAHPARPHDAIKLDRPLDALERLRAAVLDHEQPGNQPLRGVADHHSARLGGGLHARGDIRRVAERIDCI